jgi:OFA family oxalate/formate antiporter-like MFS transporter
MDSRKLGPGVAGPASSSAERQAEVAPYAWRRDLPMLIACSVIPALSVGLFVVCFPLWLVPWAAEFKISRSQAMVAFTVGNIVSTFAAPLAGRALASLSARVIMITGVGLVTAGFLMASIAPSFWVIASLYASVIAVGAALAGILPAQTVALRRFPDRAGAIGGMLALGLSAASAVAPLLVAPGLAAFGWRTVFAASGVVVGAAAVPLAWFGLGREQPNSAKEVATSAMALESVDTLVVAAPIQGTTTLLGSSAFWLLLISILPVVTVFIAISPNVVGIVLDAGLGLRMAGYLVSTVAVGSAVGGVLTGWLADRVDPRIAFTMVSAVMFGALAAVAFEPRYLVLPGLAIFGLAGGGVMPLFAVVVLRRFGAKDFPRVQGLITPFLVPAFLGPTLAAWIRDATGGYAWALLAFGLFLLPGVIAIWNLGPLRPSVASPDDGKGLVLANP